MSWKTHFTIALTLLIIGGLFISLAPGNKAYLAAWFPLIFWLFYYTTILILKKKNKKKEEL